MSLKRPFVPKSDVKQRFTTTTYIHLSTLHDVGATLAHHLRRWPSIKPTLAQRLMSAGMSYTRKAHSEHGIHIIITKYTFFDRFVVFVGIRWYIRTVFYTLYGALCI